MLWFGTLDTSSGCQTLVAQHPKGFDFGPLTVTGTVFQYLHITRAGHAVFIGFLFFFRPGTPEHQQFADVLDRRGVKFVCERLKNRFTAGAIIRLHANLDEAMRIKRRIGFFFDRISQSVGAEHHDSIEMMCFGAVILALGGSELYLSHYLIIGASGQWTIGRMKDNTRPDAKKAAQKVAGTAAKNAAATATGAGRLHALKIDPRAGTKGKKLNKAWLHEHINDPYVKLAQREGYRARAAYKLKEMDETLGLVKPGYCVVDLGSTPGAWSQYVRRKLSPTGAAAGDLNGRIIGLDLLPMDPIEGVVFIQGDFREPEVLEQLEQMLASVNGPVPVDLVISDMAPNLSGIEPADAARIAHLVELAVEFAQNRLRPDGALVVKLFHGSGYNLLVKLFRNTFKVVKPFKPKASRSNSSETFLIGRGLKTPPKVQPTRVAIPHVESV